MRVCMCWREAHMEGGKARLPGESEDGRGGYGLDSIIRVSTA